MRQSEAEKQPAGRPAAGGERRSCWCGRPELHITCSVQQDEGRGDGEIAPSSHEIVQESARIRLKLAGDSSGICEAPFGPASLQMASEQHACRCSQMDSEQHARRWVLLSAFDAAADALHPRALLDWIEDHMAKDKAWRKALSHDGAIRSLATDPVHWEDPATGVGYWDASNAVYARALHGALLYRPARPSELEHWNPETCGDIVEGILALAWRSPDDSAAQTRMVLMEHMVRIVVLLMDDLGPVWASCPPSEWADRVDNLRVAYAQAGWA